MQYIDNINVIIYNYKQSIRDVREGNPRSTRRDHPPVACLVRTNRFPAGGGERHTRSAPRLPRLLDGTLSRTMTPSFQV